jgi:RNA polymerase sigma-70 factor (ECF subfamily)
MSVFAIENDVVSLHACEDAELMAEIAGQNPAALSELYDRYGSILKALVIRVVNDEAEAEDLLQEIFLQVWRQADHYSRDKGKALGWLVTLSRRRAIDRLRRRQAYIRAKDRLETQLDCQPAAWTNVRIEEDIRNEDLRSMFTRLMKALPVLQKEAIELAFFRGMSQREIARHTTTPLGTVKTRLELGLRKLTTAIQPYRDKI